MSNQDEQNNAPVNLFIPDLPRGGYLTLAQTAAALGVSEHVVNNELLGMIVFYEGSDHIKRFCPISVQQIKERQTTGQRLRDRWAEQEKQRIRDGFDQALQQKRKPRR